MNEKIIFWRTWPRLERNIMLVSMLFISLLLIYSMVAWWLELSNVMHWDTISELKVKIFTANIFKESAVNLSASSPLWYIKERYLPSLISVNIYAYYVMLFCGSLGLVFFLVGMSRLKGLWFLVGALVLGAVLISFRLENLFFKNNNTPFLMIFAIMGIYYYLINMYAIRLNTAKAAIIGIVLMAAFFVACNYFSVINKPFMSMAAYGLICFLIITAGFIFMISHEILAGLVWLVSKNSSKDKSSLPQYLIISIIYLLNVLLVYFENANRIDESPFIMHPVFIYVISVVLGFWGFKKAVEQQEWFSFARVGVWVYVGLALMSTGTVALVFASANDPLQELLNDYIAIAQLGVGLAFFAYVLVNYLGVFKQGLEVQKVLYRSPFSRLLLSRVAAVFIIFLLFAFKNYYSYYQAQAGVNNAIADYYLEEGDLKSAETFYKVSTKYDLYNHKANFSLASLALSQNDKINGAFFFKQALEKNPSPYAYAGLSNSLESEDLFFDAMFSLKEGISRFPSEGSLYTNLAYLQGKAQLTDSLIVNLDLALKNCSNCEVENNNFLAFGIENVSPEKLEKMVNEAKPNRGSSFKANLAAVNRLLGKASENIVFDKKDSILNVSKAAYLFNVISNPENKLDFEPKALSAMQSLAENDPYYEELSWAFANQHYFRYSKIEGLKQLTQLTISTSKLKNIYAQNLGLWLLQEGVYDAAKENFTLAGDSTTANMLKSPEMKVRYLNGQELKAQTYLKTPLTIENYSEILNKAPLNPYLITEVADFLSSQKKNLEAYNTVFYATELNNNSTIIWKAYINKAIALSQFEYARDGLAKLKPLVSAKDYDILENKINDAQKAIANKAF